MRAWGGARRGDEDIAFAGEESFWCRYLIISGKYRGHDIWVKCLANVERHIALVAKCLANIAIYRDIWD